MTSFFLFGDVKDVLVSVDEKKTVRNREQLDNVGGQYHPVTITAFLCCCERNNTIIFKGITAFCSPHFGLLSTKTHVFTCYANISIQIWNQPLVNGGRMATKVKLSTVLFIVGLKQVRSYRKNSCMVISEPENVLKAIL